MTAQAPLLAGDETRNVVELRCPLADVKNILEQLPNCAVTDDVKSLSQERAMECQDLENPKAKEKDPRLFFSKIAGPTVWRARFLCFTLYGSVGVFFCCLLNDTATSFTVPVEIAVYIFSLVVAAAEFRSTREVILTVILASKEGVMPTRCAIRIPRLSWHFWFWCVSGFVLSFASCVAMFTNAVIAAEESNKFRTGESTWGLLFVLPWIAGWLHWLYAALYTEQLPGWLRWLLTVLCSKQVPQDEKQKLEYKIDQDERWSSSARSFGLWDWDMSYGESVLFLAPVVKWPSLSQLMLTLVRSNIQNLHGAATDRFGKCWQHRALRNSVIIFAAYLPYMLLHTVMVACQMLGQAYQLHYATDEKKKREMLFALVVNTVSVCAGDLVVIWQIRSQAMELAEESKDAVVETRRVVGNTLATQCADETMKCQVVGCKKECYRKKENQYDKKRVIIDVSDATPAAANGTYMLTKKMSGKWPVVFYRNDDTNAIIWQDKTAQMWKLSSSGLEDSGEYDFVWDKKDMKEQPDDQPHAWKSKSGISKCTVKIKKTLEYHHAVCEAHRNAQEFLKEHSLCLSLERCRFPPSQLARFHVYAIITMVFILAAMVLTATTPHVWESIEGLRYR